MFERLRNINLRTVSLLLFLFGIFLISIPLLFTLPTWLGIDFSSTGQIGDTIGGTTAPFIGFGGIILTFAAFWVQYRANINQREDIRVERFENKFYEMVRLHRENLDEISIGRERPVTGRRAFISMFEELKYGYHILEMRYGASRETGLIDAELTPADLVNISYIMFFLGVGDSSNQLTQRLLSDYPEPLIVNYIEDLTNTQGQWRNNDRRAVEITNIPQPFLPNLSYIPFQGHMSRLGHYYRHLWQTVRYVDDQPDDIIDSKYDNYLKMLRAQLSSHEQLLFYYNSLSSLGRDWIEEGYLQRYCLVKNIPLPLADFGPNPVDILVSYQ